MQRWRSIIWRSFIIRILRNQIFLKGHNWLQRINEKLKNQSLNSWFKKGKKSMQGLLKSNSWSKKKKLKDVPLNLTCLQNQRNWLRKVHDVDSILRSIVQKFISLLKGIQTRRKDEIENPTLSKKRHHQIKCSSHLQRLKLNLRLKRKFLLKFHKFQKANKKFLYFT